MSTKSRLSMTIDADSFERAMKLTSAKSKRQTIERAVNDLLVSEKRRQFASMIGTGVFGATEGQFRKRRRQKHGPSK